MNNDATSQEKVERPDAFFKDPLEVAIDPALSTEQKKEVLGTLEQDARQVSVASDEGMTGGEPVELADVLDAKTSLELLPTTLKPKPEKETNMAGELHEDRSILGPELLDKHRAISTLMEELEAIDWYDQRIQACSDHELRAILTHNRDEETEHASMLLEWLRRHDASFDLQLKKYLFTEGPIREAGAASDPGAPAG